MLAIAAAAMILGGCAVQTPPQAEPIQTAESRYDEVFGVSRSVLRGYQFEIDRIDRRAGLIQTFPMTGKSWFEFWRKDGATVRDTMESTLQTIYRKAIVEVVETGAGTYGVKVRVEVSRADRREVQITNTSQALGLFQLQRGHRRYERAFGLTGIDRAPVELPDDERLAMKIQSEIEKKLFSR